MNEWNDKRMYQCQRQAGIDRVMECAQGRILGESSYRGESEGSTRIVYQEKRKEKEKRTVMEGRKPYTYRDKSV